MNSRKTETQFLEAYDKYADPLYRYCFFRVGNLKSVAEDLVQETFTKTWQYLSDGHTIDQLRAFLYQTARNLIIDRGRKKENENTSLDAMQETGFDPSGQNSRTIEQEVECQRLKDVMKDLDENDRDLLILRFIEGYGPKEIAKILKETPNVISIKIHRAKKRLKNLYVPKP